MHDFKICKPPYPPLAIGLSLSVCECFHTTGLYGTLPVHVAITFASEPICVCLLQYFIILVPSTKIRVAARPVSNAAWEFIIKLKISCAQQLAAVTQVLLQCCNVGMKRPLQCRCSTTMRYQRCNFVLQHCRRCNALQRHYTTNRWYQRCCNVATL